MQRHSVWQASQLPHKKTYETADSAGVSDESVTLRGLFHEIRKQTKIKISFEVEGICSAQLPGKNLINKRWECISNDLYVLSSTWDWTSIASQITFAYYAISSLWENPIRMSPAFIFLYKYPINLDFSTQFHMLRTIVSINIASIISVSVCSHKVHP